MADAIGARAYKECSALKGDGVDEAFEAATRASMLMREGVPTEAGKQHGRRSSMKGSAQDREESKSWGCCVIC